MNLAFTDRLGGIEENKSRLEHRRTKAVGPVKPDSLPPAGIEPASTRLEGECIVRYATGASLFSLSRGGRSELATAEHGVGGAVRGQFAAEDVH